jgi:N6-L-threonylcarbamoyladenine synthase
VRLRQEALGTLVLPDHEVRDIAASFQRRVVETLTDRLFLAARWTGARSIGIAGGVSANRQLRATAEARGAAIDVPVYVPRLSLSTDNAAMIAAAGLRQLERGRLAPADLNASASLSLV